MEKKYPEPGFYYHYKHDPNGTVGNFAYEVLNMGSHTEMDWDEGKMVVYRPLYPEAKVYQEGKMWDIRPLALFMEAVDKPEYKGPRFVKIADESVIEKLIGIRGQMYSANS